MSDWFKLALNCFGVNDFYGVLCIYVFISILHVFISYYYWTVWIVKDKVTANKKKVSEEEKSLTDHGVTKDEQWVTEPYISHFVYVHFL